jgi:phosphoribosyl-ATP pyrophosphohydrolase/phosphoribosyl-AMP cyclohydrolase
MNIPNIRWNPDGLVPAIAQDVRTGRVLMLAYMNEASLRQTLETGFATYYSRSRQKLWTKGETSGHTQRVRAMAYDCDADAVLLRVEQAGPACHTGAESCFFNAVPVPGAQDAPETTGPEILQEIYNVILDRRAHPKEGSYTNYLLEKGVEKICKKVGEEASETIIAAIKGSQAELRYEAADLLYHLLVLLANQNLTPEDLYQELAARKK